MTFGASLTLALCIIPHSIAVFLSQATTFSALAPCDFHLPVHTKHIKRRHVHARADTNGIAPSLAISTIRGMFVDVDIDSSSIRVNNPQNAACCEFATSWQLLNGLLETPTLSFVESGT
jgi:hypothetical protein